MKHRISALMLTAALLAVAVAVACSKHEESRAGAQSAATSEPKHEQFKVIHVADLERMKASDPKLVILDANDDDFRKENGIIPGAKLLTSSNAYDVAKELPADKGTPLVFYCSNSH